MKITEASSSYFDFLVKILTIQLLLIRGEDCGSSDFDVDAYGLGSKQTLVNGGHVTKRQLRNHHQKIRNRRYSSACS